MFNSHLDVGLAFFFLREDRVDVRRIEGILRYIRQIT